MYDQNHSSQAGIKPKLVSQKAIIAADKKAAAEAEYLNEESCAAKFGVSVFFLRKLRYQNRIPATSIGGRMILYPVAEVRSFFERATTIGAKGKCGAIHGKWAAKRAPRPNTTPQQVHPSPRGEPTSDKETK